MQKLPQNNSTEVLELLANALGRTQDLIDHQQKKVTELDRDIVRLTAQLHKLTQRQLELHEEITNMEDERDRLRGN